MGKMASRFEPAVIMCKKVFYDNIDKRYYCSKFTDGFRVPKHCRNCEYLTLEHLYEYRRTNNER